MTITELKYIIALAKEQHFGRAAQSVFVSQPTLSIGIKKLEEELGIAIFERLPNKVMPTQTGLRIIEAAKNTLINTDIIRSIANEAKGKIVGNIKLGAIYTICPYLLPKIIPDLQQTTPDMRLYITEDYTNNLIESLKDGALDIALLSLPIPESNFFEVEPISDEEFFVIMPKGHLLEKKKSISQQDLDDERIFLLGGGNCFRDQVLQACPNCSPSSTDDKSVIQSGSLETIRMMVSSGLGVSIFPKMALDNNVNISIRPFAAPAPKRKIALVWRKSFIQHNAIEAVKASILVATTVNQ